MEDIFWDLLTLKMVNKIKVVLYNHNVVSEELLRWGRMDRFIQKLSFYRLFDLCLCLSSATTRFFEMIGANALYVPNPIDVEYNEGSLVKTDSKDIVWIGRMAPSKRVVDAVEIFKIVAEKVPQARLVIVGGDSGAGGGEEKELLDAKIAEYGLEDKVILTGPQADTKQYYREAKVFLSTAQFEGFPISHFEAMSFGLPIVSYNLPYLEYYRYKPWGFAPIDLNYSWPQLSWTKAAWPIIKMFQNDDYWQSLHNAQLQTFQKFAEIDLAKVWKYILDNRLAIKPLETETGQVLGDLVLINLKNYLQVFHANHPELAD